MRTLTYFVQHEDHGEDELGRKLECWAVYERVTLHFPYGDAAGEEYQTSFASEAEARAFVDHLFEEVKQ